MPPPLPARRVPHHLWQSLPWNGLFWLLTGALLIVSTGFAVQVEVHRARVHAVDATAVLQDGDVVEVLVVLSGDELIVGKQGSRAKVRLLGIRAFDPVVNEFEVTTFGRASVSFLESWLMGHEVKLSFDAATRDVHGRLSAYVERDGVDVNQRTLEEGVCAAYTEYPFARESAYLSSEATARHTRRGIWGSAKATARVKALRRDWNAARKARIGQAPADPLEH